MGWAGKKRKGKEGEGEGEEEGEREGEGEREAEGRVKGKERRDSPYTPPTSRSPAPDAEILEVLLQLLLLLPRQLL